MARRPRRSLRPSFVVTASVTAVLVGCGGQVGSGDSTDTGIGGHNPPGSFDARVLDACPPTAPIEGTACVGTFTCDYTSCGLAGSSGYLFQCQSGAMVKMGAASCNPPAPTCPPTRPAEGSSCSGSSFGGCSYPDTCDHRPASAPTADFFICGGMTWRMTSAPYVATCPATPPTHGSSCACGAHYFGDCNYGDCYGMPTTEAKCDPTTGTWNVMISTCNPPAPDAGFDIGVSEVGSADAGSAGG